VRKLFSTDWLALYCVCRLGLVLRLGGQFSLTC